MKKTIAYSIEHRQWSIYKILSRFWAMDVERWRIYVFCNRARDKVKLLIWHRNGFWLLYKRLDKQRFHWPHWFSEETLCLSIEQLDQLLDGYNLNGMRPHHAYLASVTYCNTPIEVVDYADLNVYIQHSICFAISSHYCCA